MTAPQHTHVPLSHRRLATIVLAGVLVALTLVGCAAGVNPTAGGPGAAGFWLGLWHGFIAPIAFVVSLFNHTVGIYVVHNSGGWYDFGFLAGISAFFSGPVGARRTRHWTRTERS